MFVEVLVVLAGVEFTIFLLDKEERRCLGGVRGANFSCSEVFFEEVFGGFLFVRGERVYFAYLRHEGLIKVDLVVIRLGRGDMVSCFFQEDLGEVGIFRWE